MIIKILEIVIELEYFCLIFPWYRDRFRRLQRGRWFTIGGTPIANKSRYNADEAPDSSRACSRSCFFKGLRYLSTNEFYVIFIPLPPEAYICTCDKILIPLVTWTPSGKDKTLTKIQVKNKSRLTRWRRTGKRIVDPDSSDGYWSKVIFFHCCYRCIQKIWTFDREV